MPSAVSTDYPEGRKGSAFQGCGGFYGGAFESGGDAGVFAGRGHGEDGFDKSIVVIAEAGERPQAGDIDFAVADGGVVDMDGDDPAEHDVDAAHGAVSWQAGGLQVFAFEMDGGVFDAFGRDELRGDFRQARAFEFIDAQRQFFRGDIDGLAQRVGGHVPDEFPARLGVDDAVLAPAGGILIGGKHDDGRIEPDILKLAIRRKIIGPIGADGGNPPNRPRHDAGFERVEGQTMIGRAGLVVHAASGLDVLFGRKKALLF